VGLEIFICICSASVRPPYSRFKRRLVLIEKMHLAIVLAFASPPCPNAELKYDTARRLFMSHKLNCHSHRLWEQKSRAIYKNSANICFAKFSQTTLSFS